MHCPCRPEPYNHVAEGIFSEVKKMPSENKAYPVPPCKRAPAQLSMREIRHAVCLYRRHKRGGRALNHLSPESRIASETPGTLPSETTPVHVGLSPCPVTSPRLPPRSSPIASASDRGETGKQSEGKHNVRKTCRPSPTPEVSPNSSGGDGRPRTTTMKKLTIDTCN